MSFSVKIQSDFPDALEKELIEEVCEKWQCPNAYVCRFSRFGFSGARLLLLYFGDGPAGLPFLLKIGELGKMEDELSATKLLKNDLMDAQLPMDGVVPAEDSKGKLWGALLYHNRATDNPEGAANPQALSDLIYSPTKQLSSERLEAILGGVFKKLKNAHLKSKIQEVNLNDTFERYFREHASMPRVSCILGSDRDSERISFIGAETVNPLKFLKKLPKNASMCIGKVHGDVHPDNIVIDQEQLPHLIDFAWAHENRDVLVDFVLLENSIRFRAFPRPMNLKDQLEIDEALLDEDGYDQIGSRTLCGPERTSAYTRLACAVKVIRTCAKELLRDGFTMQRYLLAQFIVLYGLLSYKEYEPYASTRALGLMASRLEEIGFPSDP